MSENVYDASISKIINACIDELVESENVKLYTKESNELFTKHSLLLRKSSLDNLEKLKLTESIVSKFANKITAKTFMQIDMKNMFKLLESKIPNKSISLKDKVETELEYLGYIDIKVDTKKPLYYVLELKEYKNKHSSTYYTLLHNLKTGEDIKYKIKKYINYIENPFKEKCIISINKENKENKKHKRKDENGNDVFDSKGKQIWDITPNEFNNILESWTVY